MTKQRQLIYDIIKQSPVHLTAEEIYKTAKTQQPSIAIATVYRNLKLMEQAGEVCKVRLYGKPDRYDKLTEPHQHLICSHCGRLEDIHLDGLDAFLSQQSPAPIDAYDLNIYYTCPACRAQML